MTTNAVAFAHFLDRLQKGDASRQDLARVSGLHHVTVGNYLRAIRRINPRLVYISDYARDRLGRCNIPLYSLGDGTDVKPTLKTRREIVADYRKRKQQRALLAFASPAAIARTAEGRKRISKGTGGDRT